MNTPVDNEGTRRGKGRPQAQPGGEGSLPKPRALISRSLRGEAAKVGQSPPPPLPDRCGWGGGFSAYCPPLGSHSVLSPCPSTPPPSLAPAHQPLPTPQPLFTSSPSVFPSSSFGSCLPPPFKPPTPRYCPSKGHYLLPWSPPELPPSSPLPAPILPGFSGALHASPVGVRGGGGAAQPASLRHPPD